MAQKNQDWDILGKDIQDIIDRAVGSRDFQKLNQSILRPIGNAVDLGTEAVRKAVENKKTQEPKIIVEPKDLSLLYGNHKPKMTAGILKTVFGGILTGFSFMGFLGSMIAGWFFEGLSVLAVPALLGLGGGGLLLGSGIRGISRIKRFKTYCKTLGEKTHCTLDRLARSVGKSVKYVRKELKGMINEGLFLEGHLDKEGTSLITSHETYHYYEQSRLALEERQKQEALVKAKREASPHTPQVQEVLDKGDAFVAQIRKCNDDIPGEEISRKISYMENIVEKIFDRAEEHPEIVPDLKKLMDYYLPMTIKLLNAYADMDAQPVQGETIQSSKREIEATLDTLNVAFEKLLDELFQDTALDVSSDISVLNTLLAQEGLTEDDLTRMKKESAL